MIVAELAEDLASAALALARRFAAGGTLWCWAPDAPHHAQHLAVEFVHPVVMGTRALPAVAVLEPDAAGALRTMTGPGDVLVVVAGGSPAVVGALRRARARGLHTIWLGCGARPMAGDADHVLWVGDDDGAAHDGRLVLGYHLLWELTHVCFEHPGLLGQPVSEVGTEVCTTCSDEGRLAEVLFADGEAAQVRTPTGVEHIGTQLVGPLVAGDLVLVHAGTAITVVDG